MFWKIKSGLCRIVSWMLSVLYLILVIHHKTFLLPCNIFFLKSHLIFPGVVLREKFTTQAYFPEPGLKQWLLVSCCDLSLKSRKLQCATSFYSEIWIINLMDINIFGVLIDLAFLWCFSCMLRPRRGKLWLI